MSEPERPSGPHMLEGELVCPGCGNEVLEAVSDSTQTNFLCHRCWTCWHVELGFMAPVPVATCPGCPYKPECLRRRGTTSIEEEHHASQSSP